MITEQNLRELKKGDRISFESTSPYVKPQLATVTANFLPDDEEFGHLYFIEDEIPNMEFELYYEEVLKYADTTNILDETKADVDQLIEALPTRGRLFELYDR